MEVQSYKLLFKILQLFNIFFAFSLFIAIFADRTKKEYYGKISEMAR